VRLVKSDLFAGLERNRYDLILCNPPYVPGTAMRSLPREYLHEPRRALAAGEDGLELVRRIIDQARGHLRPQGLLVCEIGGNRRALQRAYPRTPFRWLSDQVFLLRREDLPRVEKVG
jgi:ribosomal protein L3 glutamine methyltransferase